MSVQNEIDRIIGLVSDSHEKVKARGGETAEPYLLANLPGAIESIPKGVELPKLTNPASASDITEGMDVIGADGKKITGALPEHLSYNSPIDTNYKGPFVRGTEFCIEGYIPEDSVIRKDSVIRNNMPIEMLGDATAEDVVAGKTFTSADGFVVTGTHECEAGLDTSDATATASDMAQGVTAYVNGEKVTGTVLTVSREQSIEYPNTTLYTDNANNKIVISGKAFPPTLLRQSATVKLAVSSDSFGDATAADVAAGKTFTSADGLKVTGTMEPGVELPELTNPASASDIVKGKEAIGADGNVITGEVLAINGFNTSMNASGMSVNGTDLVMTSHQHGSFMLNADSDIVFKTPLNLFGDATAEDVAEGVIFTSEQGFRKTGTMKRGIDTSDATATASDMAEGVTAYVNGEKVTGTLTKAGTPLGNEMVVNVEGGAPYESGGYLVAYSDNPFAERQIVDEKIRINVLTDLEHLGDAAAADVVKGKFFTSVAGVMVEGTKEDSPATQAVVLVAEATPSANSLTLEFTGLSGEPTLFSVHPKENITLGSTRYILGVDYDGENTVGIQGYSSGSFMSSSATATYSATAFSWTYANGTLTVTSGSATTGGYFMSGITYQLVYITDTLTQGEVVGPSLDLSQVTVTEASMLDGVKAYDKTGKLIEGSIQSQAAQTITPKTTDQTIAAGKYLSGIQTIKGDSNLIAGNIKKGVSIFGVAGSHEGGGSSGDIVKGWAETNVTLASGTTARVNVGTAVTHTNGKVSISNSTSVKVSSVDDLEQCKGKYAQRYGTGTTTYDVYFIPEDATFTQGGSTYNKSFTVDTANPMVVLA